MRLLLWILLVGTVGCGGSSAPPAPATQPPAGGSPKPDPGKKDGNVPFN